MKIHGKASISDNATIEEKVDFLLGRVEAIDSAIVRVDSRVDEVNSLLEKLGQEYHASVDTLSTTLTTLLPAMSLVHTM